MCRLTGVSQGGFCWSQHCSVPASSSFALLYCLLFSTQFNQGSAPCVDLQMWFESQPSSRVVLKITGFSWLAPSFRAQKLAPNKSNPKIYSTPIFPSCVLCLPGLSPSVDCIQKSPTSNHRQKILRQCCFTHNFDSSRAKIHVLLRVVLVSFSHHGHS